MKLQNAKATRMSASITQLGRFVLPILSLVVSAWLIQGHPTSRLDVVLPAALAFAWIVLLPNLKGLTWSVAWISALLVELTVPRGHYSPMPSLSSPRSLILISAGVLPAFAAFLDYITNMKWSRKVSEATTQKQTPTANMNTLQLNGGFQQLSNVPKPTPAAPSSTSGTLISAPVSNNLAPPRVSPAPSSDEIDVHNDDCNLSTLSLEDIDDEETNKRNDSSSLSHTFTLKDYAPNKSSFSFQQPRANILKPARFNPANSSMKAASPGVVKASWVAGGYWQDMRTGPLTKVGVNRSRASSQSSGFVSHCSADPGPNSQLVLGGARGLPGWDKQSAVFRRFGGGLTEASWEA